MRALWEDFNIVRMAVLHLDGEMQVLGNMI
jgi:hypothetical protein